MWLITNVQPEQGGPVTWDTPELDMESNATGRCFKGSPSLLKSALQKNVRLCRAGSAVRCSAGPPAGSNTVLALQVPVVQPACRHLNARHTCVWESISANIVYMHAVQFDWPAESVPSTLMAALPRLD